MKIRVLLLLSCAAFMPATTWADVKPHTICSEGMVLQQKSDANIWGSATRARRSRSPSAASWRRRRPTTQGRWLVAVADRRRGRAVRNDHQGQEQHQLQEHPRRRGLGLLRPVEHGMEGRRLRQDRQGLRQSAPHQPEAPHRSPSKQAIRRPTSADREPRTASWIEAEPKTVGDFSAVGYFFGRNLQEELQGAGRPDPHELGRHAHRGVDEQGSARRRSRKRRRTRRPGNRQRRVVSFTTA